MGNLAVEQMMERERLKSLGYSIIPTRYGITVKSPETGQNISAGQAETEITAKLAQENAQTISARMKAEEQSAIAEIEARKAQKETQIINTETMVTYYGSKEAYDASRVSGSITPGISSIMPTPGSKAYINVTSPQETSKISYPEGAFGQQTINIGTTESPLYLGPGVRSLSPQGAEVLRTSSQKSLSNLNTPGAVNPVPGDVFGVGNATMRGNPEVSTASPSFGLVMAIGIFIGVIGGFIK